MEFSGRTWRPAFERWTPVIEATSGCAWGRCAFCTLYEQERFRVVPLERFCRDLDELKAVVPSARRLWLTGGDPFQMGFRHLEDRALAVRDRLIKMQTIAMFASVRDIKRYSDRELHRLSLLRVGGLVIGMESVDDRTLALAGKGYTARDVTEQCLRLERAGMEYSLIYMTGLAGDGRGRATARRTVEAVNNLRPRFFGTTSLTIFPGSRFERRVREGSFATASEAERIDELIELVRGLSFRTFFDARSPTNAIPVAGLLPYDRDRILATLDHARTHIDEDALAAHRRELREP